MGGGVKPVNSYSIKMCCWLSQFAYDFCLSVPFSHCTQFILSKKKLDKGNVSCYRFTMMKLIPCENVVAFVVLFVHRCKNQTAESTNYSASKTFNAIIF